MKFKNCVCHLIVYEVQKLCVLTFLSLARNRTLGNVIRNLDILIFLVFCGGDDFRNRESGSSHFLVYHS